MRTMTELKKGDILETALEPVSRMDLIRYSGASGDYNPIHTVDAEATKAGLPGIIAHGMWTMGNMTKLFTNHFEEGFIQDFSIRFSGMVFLNDAITLKAEVLEAEEDHISFAVKAVNQHSKDVIKGKVTFSLYP